MAYIPRNEELNTTICMYVCIFIDYVICIKDTIHQRYVNNNNNEHLNKDS